MTFQKDNEILWGYYTLNASGILEKQPEGKKSETPDNLDTVIDGSDFVIDETGKLINETTGKTMAILRCLESIKVFKPKIPLVRHVGHMQRKNVFYTIYELADGYMQGTDGKIMRLKHK